MGGRVWWCPLHPIPSLQDTTPFWWYSWKSFMECLGTAITKFSVATDMNNAASTMLVVPSIRMGEIETNSTIPGDVSNLIIFVVLFFLSTCWICSKFTWIPVELARFRIRPILSLPFSQLSCGPDCCSLDWKYVIHSSSPSSSSSWWRISWVTTGKDWLSHHSGQQGLLLKAGPYVWKNVV